MSIFDPEKIARNKAIVDAMPAWKRGEPINERRVSEVDKLKAVNTQLLKEMKRYLPIIEAIENGNPGLWDELARPWGIATANGYRAAIQAAKEGK